MNLGERPWKGAPPNLWTECGCYPPPERSKTVNRLPTTAEKIEAILGARQPVADYLGSIGKLEAFETFSKDEICGLIRAAHDGVQSSLKQQVAEAFNGDDEIPF